MKLSRIIKLLPIMAVAVFFSQGAQAVTPANALLTNTAKLVYDGNATGIEATVDVRVTLITANVTITPAFNTPLDQTKAENQAFNTTYFVYAQNNGLDNYTISHTATTPTNVTGTTTGSYTPNSIDLGASALKVLSTATTTFTVPSDGDGAGNYGTPDNNVNGLAIGDTIIIGTGTVEYTITAIADDGTNNAVITVDTAIPGGLAIGTGVFESTSFQFDISDVGSLTATTGNVVVTTSVTNGTDTFNDDIQINVVQINFDKYVRCVSDCDDSSGTGSFEYDPADNSVDGGGNNYYTGAVTSEPNGVLEYLLVVGNPTATDITNAVLSDELPAFTSYEAATTLLNAEAVDDEGGFPLDAATADNGGLEAGDTSGRTAGAEDDGTIGASTTIYVVYQVRVGS